MGFSACPICTEDLQDEIVTTKCGHIFHDICVSQWLKNNRACPTCRSHASKRELIKLFLNNSEDSFSLSQMPVGEFNHEALVKCQKLNEKLNKRIDDLNEIVSNLKSVTEEKEKENETLLLSKCSLEKELKNTRHTCSNLRTKMKYMAEDAEKTKRFQEKAKLLEREMRTMRGLKAILEGSQSECEEVLRNTTDIETMAHLMTGLKRDYNSLQKSKAEVQQQAEELQRKVSYSRLTTQALREELEEMKQDKQQIEQDLSTAERKNESLSKKIGVFEDRSLNNTNLLYVSKNSTRRSLPMEQQTPIQMNKRQRQEQSTPILFDDDLSELDKQFEAELSRDDDLDRLAAELGVDINMATTPGKAELKTKDVKEDNLFTKVGFDGLGGTTRIRKNLPPPRSIFAKQHKTSGPSLARSTTLGNFFRKL
ncbi:E3 ubiquitin-protein ligase TRAIP-like [Bolinopsis microptera]|uniref:E3 ubiquitin-protein ligase TRAIP-like n=1 Tax=Bolinopsis microptera TaxID=2820187 RepID=UPI003079F79C